MFASFNRFEIQMTKSQAQSASHQEQCDADVATLVQQPSIARQFRKIDPQAIRAELKEYDAWDAAELTDDAQNQQRLIWIAAGNIVDEKHA